MQTDSVSLCSLFENTPMLCAEMISGCVFVHARGQPCTFLSVVMSVLPSRRLWSGLKTASRMLLPPQTRILTAAGVECEYSCCVGD